MKFGSVCSGIEAASVAWEPLGWKASWLSEIEPFPSAVLEHHWPDVINVGDMSFIPFFLDIGLIEAPDVLVGGTPCQSFSLAGLRKGLSDDRGFLTLTYVEIFNKIDEVRRKHGKSESICVWENVPGVLTSRDNAFGCFLAGLAGEDVVLQPPGGKWKNAGYVSGPQRTVAWRVLDAQHFGVAQRRRRVFVVASARKDFCPTEVLFEFEGLRRDSAPDRKEERKDSRAFAIRSAQTGANGIGVDEDLSYTLDSTQGQVCWWDGGQISQTLDAVLAKGQMMPEKNRFPCVIHGTQHPITGDKAFPLARNSGQENAVFSEGCWVRRLMPIECERLQGFPDNHTLIPWKNKPAEDCPDTPRYKALGNSMAVPVMNFIGQRIQLYVDFQL